MKGLIQLRNRLIALVLLILFSLLSLTSCQIDWSNPFHVHSYVESVVEPTCEEKGYTLKKCSECGYEVKTNYKDALGHDEEIIEGYPKSCSEDGLSDGIYCNRCQKVIKEQEVIPAGHNWKYSYSLPPTCEQDGIVSGKECLDCGVRVSNYETMPKLGHDYGSVEESILSHKRVKHECSRCHKVTYDSLTINYKANHDYKEFSTNSLYSNYKQVFTTAYKELYEDCMEVLTSDKDYTFQDSSVASTKSSFNISKKALTAFTSSFLNNNPQFYFLSNGYSMKTASGEAATQLVLKIDSEYYKHSVRENINKNINLVEREVYELVKNETSDVLKAKAIHDYLANKTDYEYVGGKPSKRIHAHNFVGIFDNDNSTGSVCEGYANAYVYLCSFVGIESIMVTGYAGDDPHAWNYTKINNLWYGVDVTWDDQNSKTYYDYFLASKSEMENGTKNFNASHEPFNDSILNYEERLILQTTLPVLSSERGYNESRLQVLRSFELRSNSG